MSTTVQVNGLPAPRVVVGESGSKIVGLIITGAGGGTVTSFSATPSGIFDVANATTTPALSLDKQNANIVLAGPTTGSADTPSFRSLVAADIPDLSGTYLVDADIGVSVQGYSANLAEYAAVNPTAAGLDLLDDANAAAQRTTLGGTTVGQAYFTLTNPGAVTWPRMNADNTVTALSAGDTRTALGLLTFTSGGILTGNTLWVDAVNGNDTTGTTDRQDLPYLTLAGALADAVSGDLIYVRPGAYTVTASLATNGVNWHFEAGATVTMTSDSPATRVGIWDDGGTAKTFKVTGAGSFTHTITTEATTEDCNVICNSHASSNIYIECLDITISAETIYARAVNAIAGTLVVRCRNMSASLERNTAIWWENGPCYVNGVTCYGYNSAVYSAVDDTPTGDLQVRFDEIEASDSAVYAIGTNGDAALWVRANIVTGGVTSVYNGGGNLNKTYVESQKIIGQIENDGGLMYVRADKVSNPATNSLFYGNNATSDSYIQVNHWDATAGAAFIYVTNGTHRFFGGFLVGDADVDGLTITGGTVTVQNFHINTAANASTNPIVKSGGTLTLDGCTLVAEGTRNAIEAGDAQSVAVAGVLMANRPNHANVTLTGGIFIRSDTGAVTLVSDLDVANGGTGRSTSTTAYGLIAAGTTATGAHQTLAAGATTEILVGGGASALPAWTAATGTGAPVRGTSPGFTTAANPVSNDGAALGTTALGWSDAHFATGAVINFANGNLTMTHSAAAMSVTGTWTFVTSPTSPGSGANTERFGASASTSTATNATAIGNGASASGDYGTAVGRAASASTGAVAIGGFATASATRSFCLAYNSTASHQDSYVFGSNGGVSFATSSFTFHATSAAPTIYLSSYDDTGVEEIGTIGTAWASATHASRKGRVIFSVYDTAAREGMRIEASGSAPMIGFYGETAVARQTVSGARDDPEGALASLLVALDALGLITDSTTAS